MKISSIFGTHLRPTHEYVGWLKTVEGIKHLSRKKHSSNESEFNQLLVGHLSEAHTFLSEPNQLSDFVKPPEPKEEEFVSLAWTGGSSPEPSHDEFDKDGYEEAHKQWQNQQPLYKGEWEVDNGDPVIIHWKGQMIWFSGDRMLVQIGQTTMEFNTRNDFATHCMNLGIELEINDVEI